MKGFLSLICGVYLFTALAAAAAIPDYFRPSPVTRRSVTVEQVRQELGASVSDTTLIYGPTDTRYANATARWNDYAIPHVQIVVVPGQQSDVPKIVQYCNQNSLEFLAINHGHGNSVTLGSFNGVQINMANFNQIEIQPDGQSAWFGGGTYDGQVVKYLWDHGYITTTGSCDCVGMMGPALGGGLGRLQGPYGLIADNIVELNVVLASGEMIVVNSTSHSDLLWGMKGAGHNFGIVTSFRLKIYPRGPDTWHYHNYIWRGDKLEAVFDALNAFAGNNSTPVNMTTNFGNFLMNATISTTEPVMWWTFAYRGPAAEAEALLAPFNAIGSAYEEQDDVAYPLIPVAQQTDVDSFICQKGFTRITDTSLLQVYNVTAERQIFDSFQRTLNAWPALAMATGILHEGYSTQAVQAVPLEDSAYPWRLDQHLNLIQIIVDPSNSTLVDQAWKWANEVRGYWDAGAPDRPPHIYVNYANGYESKTDIYGAESWRLQRLTTLKEQYDPDNRFHFYNPIISPEGMNSR